MHASNRYWLTVLSTVGIALFAAACQESTEPVAASSDPTGEARPTASAEVDAEPLGLADSTSNATADATTPKRHPSERPLPAFTGTDEERWMLADWLAEQANGEVAR